MNETVVQAQDGVLLQVAFQASAKAADLMRVQNAFSAVGYTHIDKNHPLAAEAQATSLVSLAWAEQVFLSNFLIHGQESNSVSVEVQMQAVQKATPSLIAYYVTDSISPFDGGVAVLSFEPKHLVTGTQKPVAARLIWGNGVVSARP